MTSDEPPANTRSGSPFWIDIDPDSPLYAVARQVKVTRDPARWPEAPEFSSRQFSAVPVRKNVGMLEAAWILLKDRLRKRDDIADRLADIEGLIVAGHNAAADRQIRAFLSHHQDIATRASVLGLMSLNAYDRGREGEARVAHQIALAAGCPHPAMIEVFGLERDAWQDDSPEEEQAD